MAFEIGLFDDTVHAEAAIERLHQAGFTNDQISLVSQDKLTGDDRAAIYDNQTGDIGGVVGLVGGFFLGAAAGAVVLAIPGIGPAIATGAVAGVKLAPALMDSLGVVEDDADFLAEAIRRDGVVLAVEVDPAQQAQVAEIMRHSQAVQIKERRRQYELQGWAHSPSERGVG